MYRSYASTSCLSFSSSQPRWLRPGRVIRLMGDLHVAVDARRLRLLDLHQSDVVVRIAVAQESGADTRFPANLLEPADPVVELAGAVQLTDEQIRVSQSSGAETYVCSDSVVHLSRLRLHPRGAGQLTGGRPYDSRTRWERRWRRSRPRPSSRPRSRAPRTSHPGGSGRRARWTVCGGSPNPTSPGRCRSSPPIRPRTDRR